ncbi:MAG TPA: PH domain-containing protein [Flavobacteriaceae bacterium]|nr:PH domain-containing protein [Flavobacteriaceae bacterium]
MENFTNTPIELTSLPDYEKVDFQPISRKYLVKVLLSTMFFLVAILIGWGFLFYLNWNSTYIFGILFLILTWFVFAFWNVFKLQNNYGFALREKDILYRRGFLVNKITVVPFNRVQHVSTTRGILDKKLGIATLKIFTAGGSGSDINIPGLKPDLALRLKEAVSKKVSADAR